MVENPAARHRQERLELQIKIQQLWADLNNRQSAETALYRAQLRSEKAAQVKSDREAKAAQLRSEREAKAAQSRIDRETKAAQVKSERAAKAMQTAEDRKYMQPARTRLRILGWWDWLNSDSVNNDSVRDWLIRRGYSGVDTPAAKHERLREIVREIDKRFRGTDPAAFWHHVLMHIYEEHVTKGDAK